MTAITRHADSASSTRSCPRRRNCGGSDVIYSSGMRTLAARAPATQMLRVGVVLIAGAIILLGSRQALAAGVTVSAEDVTVASGGAVELTLSGHSDLAIAPWTSTFP